MKRLVVGISGASGAPIAIEVLKALKEQPDWTSDLVISNAGKTTIEMETDDSLQEVIALADTYHELNNVGASIASGTYKTEGMVIVPCSMKTVAGIASGYSDNLLLRAADVTLKERRKLVLVARETPFNHIHLKNLTELSSMGAIIMPPMMTFYNHPENMQQMIEHIVGKILDVYGIEYHKFRRWS